MSEITAEQVHTLLTGTHEYITAGQRPSVPVTPWAISSSTRPPPDFTTPPSAP